MEKQKLIDDAVAKLQALNSSDHELNHLDADAILCDLLIKLDAQPVVSAFNAIKKWYS